MKTGRKFKCVGSQEHFCTQWKDHYIIGEIYEEMEAPEEVLQGQCLLLKMNGYSYELYVDALQFELVNTPLKPFQEGLFIDSLKIVLQKMNICLN